MGSKQQPALRPNAAERGCGGDGRAASLSERSSLTNASFRVYYSLRAGAVPFLWESAPGTPKRDAESPIRGAAMLLPPLSPPPSYQSPFQRKGRKSSWTAAAGGIMRALLGVLGLRKSHRRRPAPA
ncbi:hypothetical protein CFC21_074383 [Triticum aestivum]|uniref:Uncharacterized protein n=3 Tax=Triticum TaxID=4564 RepID=A0A9R1AST1_TRITD|nr:hypothetical protein CFC21_074383 [Triticum aestivum]VAI38901.1 unnamed protein product [Triticum turgidum subsp. durum]